MEKISCPFLQKELSNDVKNLFLTTHLSHIIAAKFHFFNLKNWENQRQEMI